VDLRYSDEDQAFRAEVREWLEREVPAHGEPAPVDDWPAKRAYDTGWQRKLHDAGLAGLAWPEEHGGRGAPVSQQLVYLEEYARARAPYIGVNFVGMMHAGPTLIAEGTPEQKSFHLPRILRGESVWCQGFSEPEAGSDLASMRTRAVRDGDHYVVSGQKIWTTRAQVADYCELLVRTDLDAPKHKGITWLIMPMSAPGIEVRPIRAIDGESHFCEMFLDEVRVPVENRVGAENDGWRVTNVTLRFERGTAFAQHIIMMRAQIRALVELATSAPPGQPRAWDDGGLRRRIGWIEANIESLWRMTQMCVTDSQRTGVPPPYGSAIKLRYSELTQELTELTIEVMGRPALAVVDTNDVPVRRAVLDYLWSLQYTIAAGTSQVQRNLIAERILGLPRE
jgi:alkylation response protein AidB-like acyl-CoA dehydrogenase